MEVFLPLTPLFLRLYCFFRPIRSLQCPCDAEDEPWLLCCSSVSHPVCHQGYLSLSCSFQGSSWLHSHTGAAQHSCNAGKERFWPTLVLSFRLSGLKLPCYWVSQNEGNALEVHTVLLLLLLLFSTRSLFCDHIPTWWIKSAGTMAPYRLFPPVPFLNHTDCKLWRNSINKEVQIWTHQDNAI